MARLALLLVLMLSACALEQIAMRRHGPEYGLSRDVDSVMEECQLEASKLRFSRYRALPAQWQQAYLNDCYREVTIMRAYGRR